MNEIKPTIESLDKIRFISKNMDEKTFHFHIHILYDIRTLLGEGEKTYMEIGSFAGGSVSLLSSHDYSTKCFSIDLGHPINKTVVEKNVDKFKNKKNTFKYFLGDSHDINIINAVKHEVESVDVLFIDGDHSRDGAILDFENYKDMVNSGGYICFDDYLDFKYSPEVRGVVDDIVKNLNPSEYEIIGSLTYKELSEFTDLPSNNIFIIKKL